MTVRRNEKAAVLRYDSMPYKLHEADIADIMQRVARTQSTMHRKVQERIFVSRGILCDLPMGDDGLSVSKVYFGRAVRVVREKMRQDLSADEEKALDDEWELILDVLALHLSIADAEARGAKDKTEVAYDAYKEAVHDFDALCTKAGIPTLIPNLFLASSLFTQLTRGSSAYTKRSPEMAEMYTKLCDVLMYQKKHLHAVLNSMVVHHFDAEAVNILDTVAEQHGTTVIELCRENLVLADTYALALFSVGKHTEVVSLASGLKAEMPHCPIVCEKYVRALSALQQTDVLLHFLTKEVPLIPAGTNVWQAAKFAYLDLGWQLDGEARYDDAIHLLETGARAGYFSLQEEDFRVLYETLQKNRGNNEKEEDE